MIRSADRLTLSSNPFPTAIKNIWSDSGEDQSTYSDGFGLYSYQPALPTSLPSPPQYYENWKGQLSLSDNPANPWTSGLPAHWASQPALPWTSTHTSTRPPLSCTHDMAVISHDEAEKIYPGVKTEYSECTPYVRCDAVGSADIHGLPSPRPQALTIIPKCYRPIMSSSNHAYGAPPISGLEATPAYDYGGRMYKRSPSDNNMVSQCSKTCSDVESFIRVPRARARKHRHTDPLTAAFRCNLCTNKGFARRYNYTQHMLAHDVARRKDNVCPYTSCGMCFVRKTDLARHDQSVHQRSKPFTCSQCSNAFSRKDILLRHKKDGCRYRNQVLLTTNTGY